MDLASIRTKVTDLAKKYKYVAIVLVIGVVLMLLPSNSAKKTTVQESQLPSGYQQTVEEALAELLSKIKGAGKVQVLLTIAAGEETIYQTNENSSFSDSGSNTKIDTVTVTDSDRNQTGLIKQINPPVYQGAVIVCEGADSASVRLAIMDAVSKATGLSFDHISVLKIK